MRLSGGRAIIRNPFFTTIPIDCWQDGARRRMEFFVLTANNFTFFDMEKSMFDWPEPIQTSPTMTSWAVKTSSPELTMRS